MSVSAKVPHDGVQETVEDGPARYAVFANRLRTAFTAGIRYSAYSSELGEAFRPLTNKNVVRGLYAVSWSYVIGDVAYAGYKARELHRELAQQSKLDPMARMKTLAQEGATKVERIVEKGKEISKGEKALSPSVPQHHAEGVNDPLQHSETTHVGLVVARRAVFQSLASMALPAFTVHSIVHYSQPLFKSVQNHRVRALGPTLLGLAIIPALPVLFDEPVEHIIDTIFDYGEAALFSKKPVGQITEESEAKLKEKIGKFRTGVEQNVDAAEHKLTDKLDELKKRTASSFALPIGGLLGAGMVGQSIRRQTNATATSGTLQSAVVRSLTSLKRPEFLLLGGGMAMLAASVERTSADDLGRRVSWEISQ